MHIDSFDKTTFLYLLEDLDFPYVDHIWQSARDKEYTKHQGNKKKFNHATVFGKYLSQMRLGQWKKYCYADSEEIAKEYAEYTAKKNAEKAEEEAAYQEDLRKKYEEGEINEAQYRTLSSTESQYQRDMILEAEAAAAAALAAQEEKRVEEAVGENNQFREDLYAYSDEGDSERELLEQLTEEDKQYLLMKWGRLYKPSEWIALEKKYQEMKSSFDIDDSHTEGNLILTSKTFLKMNQALDTGDYDSFNRLSKTYDAQCKASKFTKAQNKDAEKAFVDCVGEMVRYCELNGGAIPRHQITADRDVVDTIIKDFKAYNRDLVHEDYALSNQIELYLNKKENLLKAEIEDLKKQLAEKTYSEVTDEDQLDFLEEIERLKEEDNQWH